MRKQLNTMDTNPRDYHIYMWPTDEDRKTEATRKREEEAWRFFMAVQLKLPFPEEGIQLGLF